MEWEERRATAAEGVARVSGEGRIRWSMGGGVRHG
jgi:hypothetical protein